MALRAATALWRSNEALCVSKSIVAEQNRCMRNGQKNNGTIRTNSSAVNDNSGPKYAHVGNEERERAHRRTYQDQTTDEWRRAT
jgi:hypothetical protein